MRGCRLPLPADTSPPSNPSRLTAGIPGSPQQPSLRLLLADGAQALRLRTDLRVVHLPGSEKEKRFKEAGKELSWRAAGCHEEQTHPAQMAAVGEDRPTSTSLYRSHRPLPTWGGWPPVALPPSQASVG